MSEAEFRLSDFGVDLCTEALRGRLDPVAGRDALIARVAQALARKTKRNPLLLGEPGVGKSALAEGLAQLMVSDRSPPHLRGFGLFSLQLGSILAGTAFRGEFEGRLQTLVTTLAAPGSRLILFIDEIHLLDRAGRSEGGLDAGNLLKPLLARGELACIGASTKAEWADMASRDPALARRFLPISVPEPTPDEALAMLRILRPRLERHHGVDISDEALAWAVRPFPSGRGRLPDRAIDRLDGACAILRSRSAPEASPERGEAERALRSALERFDLDAVARLRHRVLPALARGLPPRLDLTSLQVQEAEQGGADGDDGCGERLAGDQA